MTFIAMNRFRIAKGREAEFEDIWATRESNLPGLPGFVSFKLLRGPTSDDHTLFASHVVWESRQHFEDWTRSEAFRKSHGGTARSAGLYLGPPHFEGFEVVME
ncbi:MAG: antibiotic biosynthesis monooxygenase [Magnetospirillum sp.]|nr:antibiotic biosynthesis monooxygenase [Magnetospirillum sp.]